MNQLPPYEPAELVPQKGDAAMAKRVLEKARSVLATTELKLLAALPAELRERAGRIRDRFHLDAPGWFRADEPTPHLSTVASAVWDARRLEVRYRRWKAPREVTRTLDPLGVVEMALELADHLIGDV